MTHNRLIQFVSLVGVAVLLTATGILAPHIDESRKDAQVTQSPDQTLPPEVSLGTAALGSFRGLIVDVLWYRANALKEDGKYYEANQLSQWITNLQPRFPQVWAFHAWNMAYNISVATHTPDERWYWVNSGIKLLRDHGIPKNPNSPRVYKELGWIFSHKVGQISDDMHWYYKRKLAEEWHELLGAPTEGATTQQAVDTVRRIADAPKTLQDLLSNDTTIKPLWTYLRNLGYSPDVKLLRQIGGILMYNYSPDQALWAQLGITVPEHYDQRLDRIFKDATFGPAVEPLLAFLRKRVLIDTYHMEPAAMVEVMEQFGPLDWRHPAAHGAYWDHLGVRAFNQRRNTEGIDVVNIYRARVHSIQFLAHWGKVSFDPRVPGPPDLQADTRFIDKYEAALAEVRTFLEETKGTTGSLSSFESGHENFLIKFITHAYLGGHADEAQRLYAHLRKTYGLKKHNQQRFKLTLHELVVQEYKDIWDNMAAARQFIQDILFRAIHEGLANNQPELYERGVEAARVMYDRYQRDKPVNPGVHDRQRLPPFKELRVSTYVYYMTQPTPIVRRARVWRNTQIPLQQRTYDRIYTVLAAQLHGTTLDPDRVLPQPDGMAAYRQKRAAQARESGQADKDLVGTKTIERQ